MRRLIKVEPTLLLAQGRANPGGTDRIATEDQQRPSVDRGRLHCGRCQRPWNHDERGHQRACLRPGLEDLLAQTRPQAELQGTSMCPLHHRVHRLTLARNSVERLRDDR